MSYLLTNASALTALQNLTMTQNSLSQTQSELSTGLKIQNASDNSSYWSIATTMTSDNGALGAVSSALATSASMLSTFNSALNQTISVVNNIKNDLVSAQNPGANLTQIQTDITAQQNALMDIAGGAAYNGQNWLNGSVNGTGNTAAQTTVNLVGAYTNNGGVSYISLNASAVNLYTTGATIAAASGGILASVPSAGGSGAVLGGSAFAVTGASSATTMMQQMVTSVNNIISSLETAASTIGGAQDQITTQQSFVSSMQTNLSNGVAALVDADMNQVSTRLQALQTQQQLGVQSLSIANQSSQMILKLFQ